MKRRTLIISIIIIALFAAGAGFWYVSRSNTATGDMSKEKSGRSVLYWYDPMVPGQKFDKPGKSPFMDMQLVPKYADEGGDASTVSINPGGSQNLGVRLATV